MQEQRNPSDIINELLAPFLNRWSNLSDEELQQVMADRKKAKLESEKETYIKHIWDTGLQAFRNLSLDIFKDSYSEFLAINSVNDNLSGCDTIPFSLLSLAAKSGNLAICQYLVELGANPLLYDYNSALSNAIVEKNTDLIRIFLDSVSDKSILNGELKKTHLSNFGQPESFAIPCRKGMSTKDCYIFVPMAEKTSKPKRHNHNIPKTYLDMAAATNHLESVRLLIESGVKIPKEQIHRSAASLIALQHGNTEMLALFIEHGSPVQITINSFDPYQVQRCQLKEMAKYFTSFPGGNPPEEGPACSFYAGIFLMCHTLPEYHSKEHLQFLLDFRHLFGFHHLEKILEFIKNNDLFQHMSYKTTPREIQFRQELLELVISPDKGRILFYKNNLSKSFLMWYRYILYLISDYKDSLITFLLIQKRLHSLQESCNLPSSQKSFPLPTELCNYIICLILPYIQDGCMVLGPYTRKVVSTLKTATKTTTTTSVIQSGKTAIRLYSTKQVIGSVYKPNPLL